MLMFTFEIFFYFTNCSASFQLTKIDKKLQSSSQVYLEKPLENITFQSIFYKKNFWIGFQKFFKFSKLLFFYITKLTFESSFSRNKNLVISIANTRTSTKILIKSNFINFWILGPIILYPCKILHFFC